jgi:3-deoxy-D-manno-octulosonic-acid transferase
MYPLYSLLLLLFLLAYLPLSFLQDPTLRKYRRRLRERFAFYSPSLLKAIEGSRPLWVHAVSVGELMAASPLISELMKGSSRPKILLTTVTATGNQVAKERFPQAEGIIFFPLDFRWIVKRSLRQLRPRAVVLTETELWPHFLRACGEEGIPCILVNGRISHRSFRHYRLVRPFFRTMIRNMSLFLMQTEADLSRILHLGAPPSRVKWTGNLKFDQLTGQEGGDLGLRLKQELGIEGQSPVFIAGSTHQGEEEAALEAFLAAKEEVEELILILAPRHPERWPAVERMLDQKGVAWIRRSQLLEGRGRRGDIILLDTLGELGGMYSLGSVVFVGGSLVRTGGHNILEPAFYGVPILFGPHMENFREIADLFLRSGAAMVVQDSADLSRKVIWLLRHPEEARQMGMRARSVLEQNRGATQRTLEWLRDYL